jgi:hypothetical protein
VDRSDEKIEFEGSTALDSAAAPRTRGTMLWFNEAKGVGALRTQEGDRMHLSGAAFLPGEKPLGRCAGRAVEFERADAGVSRIAFLPESISRRARLRRRH